MNSIDEEPIEGIDEELKKRIEKHFLKEKPAEDPQQAERRSIAFEVQRLQKTHPFLAPYMANTKTFLMLINVIRDSHFTKLHDHNKFKIVKQYYCHFQTPVNLYDSDFDHVKYSQFLKVLSDFELELYRFNFIHDHIATNGLDSIFTLDVDAHTLTKIQTAGLTSVNEIESAARKNELTHYQGIGDKFARKIEIAVVTHGIDQQEKEEKELNYKISRLQQEIDQTLNTLEQQRKELDQLKRGGQR